MVAVGLDDVALIDADLLRVGAREVRRKWRCRGRRGSNTRRRIGSGSALQHRPAAIAVPVPRPAAQAPRRHSLQRFGLHVRRSGHRRRIAPR